MKNVFVHWHDIEGRIRQQKKWLFLFDFDGTLSPIVNQPRAAKLDKRVAPLLKKLLQNRRVKVGIVSGRSLVDIQRRVQLKKIILAGNHGLEALIGRKKLVHPNANNIRTNLELLFGEIYSKTSFIKGLLVENKGLSGSLHYRNVSSQYLKFVYSLERTLKQHSREYGFILRRGKKVLELVPNSTWHKGLFVEKIKKYFKDPFVIYIGDDVTDEDAFKVVRKNGLAIRVAQNKKSVAPYYVYSQDDVPAFIHRMVSLCR